MLIRFAMICLVSLCLLGCAHPGNWDQAKVAAKVKESLELSEISLEPNPSGGFTGTGKTAEGESYKLQVTQDEAKKRLSWKYEGDRGTIGDDFYEFVTSR